MGYNWKRYLVLRGQWPERFAARAPEGLYTGEDAPARAGTELGVGEEHGRWLWVREWDGRRTLERPIYLDPLLERQIEDYFALKDARPELFAPSRQLPICADRLTMLRFEEEHPEHRRVGLVFDNGKFYSVVCDVIRGGKGLYAYSRVVYPIRAGNGTVMIPCWEREGEEPLFGVIRQYRHALRAVGGYEFPRGFMEPGLTPEQNAAAELGQELGVRPEQIRELVPLGLTRPDTGLSGGQVHVFLVRLGCECPRAVKGHEGITGGDWLTRDQLLEGLSGGGIQDGITQAAMLLYLLRGK